MEHLTDEELESMYIELLNEIYEVITIGRYSYEAGNALKKLDPIAFKVELGMWLDQEVRNGNLDEIDGEYYRA
jgi:hypothetical protein